ncbi:ATP-binding cassette domain-containing protein [Pseudorhodobacter sp.]|uniref:ATP-binding cassette domain-containing protein n=1 Tax=Pseudorhodobacter sp. TaxID=1934400 RepID=UPI002649F9F4|nr:ATP-binding cassette domain-containing protein [Pseudorhodobacter sp.]MDN5788475.1 ATP-binding cassette domain-containing protein [Pseudorhodobacter sp.]
MTDTLLPVTLTDATVRRKGRNLLGPITHRLDGSGITIIIGPNGSGKTTLLRALHGLERLDDGRIEWAVPVAKAHRRQAYVFQTPIMLRRSVLANLRYPLTLTGTSRKVADTAAKDWAARIGLDHMLESHAPRLSGGERQKLALARALITAPEVLLLDEPSASLDGRSTREIESLLHLASAQGTRIIMATHDMGQARRLAGDALFLLSGRIHEHGAAAEFFGAPKTAELSSFLKGDIVE